MRRHAFLVGVASLANPFSGGSPLICACTRQARDRAELRRIGRWIIAGHISSLAATLALLVAGFLLIVAQHDVLGCAVALLPVATIHGLYHHGMRAL